MKKNELMRRRFLHMLFVLFVVSSMASELVAQNVSKLKGVVTGDDGYPVIGANVTVKGTTVGTITDFDGNYSIEAEKNATLVFSYIGYISQEIKLKGETVLNVLLKEDVQALGEVVVIGYGDTRKSDLSVAVSSMKVSDGLKGRSQNIEGMMQGQLPGVTIASNGGDPISSPSITIRGKGSRDG
ncbi:MAG: carboxypeptidase-like regulatory domain-containing protein, partial [Tannerellaceae bacterium]